MPNDHGAFVADMAKFLHPGLYVEIGIESGSTFSMVQDFCGVALGVDRNHVGLQGVVQMDSLEFINSLDDASVDMGFIDADHKAERAFEDFKALAPKVKGTGVIMLHDVYPPDERHLDPGACHDSWRVPGMIREMGGWDVVVLAAEYGVAVCSRRHPGPSWMNLESKE